MKTPLLFLIFNRPEVTGRVFEEIRKARPEKLYIAADGPRTDRPEDAEKCRRAREVVSHIDWPCEVHTRFQDRNLGCKIGASSAITWFFENVEEGIVLEDDCLPDQSFFKFCEEMLERYRDEPRIAMISGHNIVGTLPTPYAYVFSRYGHLWGWASWRRVWNTYDPSMRAWQDPICRKQMAEWIDDTPRWNYKQIVYGETFAGEKDTWDYQWESYRLATHALSIIPKENMIENLGFGADATHTKDTTSPLILPRRATSFPLVHHPGPLVPDDAYDKSIGPKTTTTDFYLYRLRRAVKKIL